MKPEALLLLAASTLLLMKKEVRQTVVKTVENTAAAAGLIQPRGIRNNNPGNIRWDGSTQWRGMVAADPAGFVIFDTPENGIRAMSRILDSYGRRGVITLESIISTWAPTAENNTGAYIDHLAGILGIMPGDTVQDRAGLIAGIIKHENGVQPYPLATIERGIALA